MWWLGAAEARAPRPIKETLYLVWRGDFGAAGEGFPELGNDSYIAIGDYIRRESGFPIGVDVRWYAEGLGLTYCADRCTKECGGAAYIHELGRIHYRPHLDPTIWAPPFAHELVHHVEEKMYGGNLPHCDVWMGTCEVLCPQQLLLKIGPEEFAKLQPYAPLWMIRGYYRALRGEL